MTNTENFSKTKNGDEEQKSFLRRGSIDSA